MNFANKVILITGAGSGIGAETARHFTRLNASLVLVDKNNDGLTTVGRECADIDSKEKKVSPLLIRADLTNDDEVSSIVKKTIDHFGRLDVLANIAGAYDVSLFQHSTMEQFDRLHSVNIRALYHLTLLCTPHLIATKGVIINISSCLTHAIFTNSVVYSMTKAAVDHLTKSLAVELGPKGVRVNAINPGIIDTPIFDFLGAEKNEILLHTLNRVPLKRYSEPIQIAKVVAFLASDDSSYITGVTMRVDGGVGLQ